MNNKLYVGSLPYSMDEEQLRSIFSAAGNVNSVKLITDTYTNQSKGFAFVEMASQAEAEKAIHEINQTVYGGRPIRVSQAVDKDKRSGGNSRGSNSRGGWN